jgi:hypothetical protein
LRGCHTTHASAALGQRKNGCVHRVKKRWSCRDKHRRSERPAKLGSTCRLRGATCEPNALGRLNRAWRIAKGAELTVQLNHLALVHTKVNLGNNKYDWFCERRADQSNGRIAQGGAGGSSCKQVPKSSLAKNRAIGTSNVVCC